MTTHLKYTPGPAKELQDFDGGTRLTLWHNIDRRYIAMGAAGWQRLNAQYAKQFGSTSNHESTGQ